MSVQRILLGLVTVCGVVATGHAQVTAPQTLTPRSTADSSYRTVITYNGAVSLSTPQYDLMSNGRVIFKQQDMRFDGSGYFWSPSVPDEAVRRRHYAGWVVGGRNEYWSPSTGLRSGSDPNRRATRKVVGPNNSWVLPTGIVSPGSASKQVAIPANAFANLDIRWGIMEQAKTFNSQGRDFALPLPNPVPAHSKPIECYLWSSRLDCPLPPK